MAKQSALLFEAHLYCSKQRDGRVKIEYGCDFKNDYIVFCCGKIIVRISAREEGRHMGWGDFIFALQKRLFKDYPCLHLSRDYLISNIYDYREYIDPDNIETIPIGDHIQQELFA